MFEAVAKSTEPFLEGTASIADLFLAANRELARSDARIYRSVDQHLSRTREILTREESNLGDSRLLDDPDRALQGPPSYERQTRKSLECLCRAHGIRGYSRMTKEAMIQRLKAEGVGAPPIPIHAFTKAELIALLMDVLSRQ